MDNWQITDYCLSKPGAYEDFPFGDIPVCYKVCGRLFLQLYPAPDNHKITVSCEPMRADQYRLQYPGDVAPGYHCPDRLKPYMNTVYLDRGVEDGVILEMIDHSYERVAGKLPRRDREGLRERTEEEPHEA